MPYFFGLLDFQVFILVVGYTLKNSICVRKFNIEKKKKIIEFLHSNWTFYPSVYVLKGRNIEVCKALHFWSFFKKNFGFIGLVRKPDPNYPDPHCIV